MRILSIKPTSGRDLYGTLVCEHCAAEEKLTGGYDDGHWHANVLPAFHCKVCFMNREGLIPSREVVLANQARNVNGHGTPPKIEMQPGFPIAFLRCEKDKAPEFIPAYSNAKFGIALYSLYPDQVVADLQRTISDLEYEVRHLKRELSKPE